MTFTTQDLWLATALDVAGYELNSVEKKDANRVIFTFTGDNRLRDDAEAYFTGELSLPVIEIMVTLKKLKTRITGLLRM